VKISVYIFEKKFDLFKRCKATKQQGIALATSLLILVVVTLIGLTMFRGFGLQQKIAGNTREKERAFRAAQDALEFGESWLVNAGSTAANCTSAQSTNVTVTNMLVCSNSLTNPSDPTTWPTLLNYTPPSMTVLSGGNLIASGTDINYSQAPGVYVAYVSTNVDQGGHTTNVYTVTAAGFGGSTSSESVVQSVYAVTLGVKINNLGGSPINPS